LRTWKWLATALICISVASCSPKTKPALTLAATIAPPTNIPATPTLTPAPTPTETPPPTPTPLPLAAMVNGQPILLADFEREMTHAGEQTSPRLVLDAMIEMTLLEQAAAATGIVVTDEEIDALLQADIDAVGGREEFERRLASNDMTEAEYRAQVRANLLAQRVQMQTAEIPATVEHVHARHILVATQAEAENILAQLRAGADFDALARTYSLDVSTRDHGGDLDFFPRGLLLSPELEEAAFALAPGQISDVVHSELLGYHIVQVLECEERPLAEAVRSLIQDNLSRRWREQLWAGATIERFVEP